MFQPWHVTIIKCKLIMVLGKSPTLNTQIENDSIPAKLLIKIFLILLFSTSIIKMYFPLSVLYTTLPNAL